MLTLQKILNSQSTLLEGKRVKLVRHAGVSEQYREAIKDKAEFLERQKRQGRDVFHGCDYIVSFRGLEHGRSLFAGVFAVGKTPKPVKDGFLYDLKKIDDFEDLSDRLVIDWGGSKRNWVQWYHKQPKEVVEILPRGYIGAFPGYRDCVLEFNDLKALVESPPESNREWKQHLSAVSGVYLILDTETGKHYVGSASGEERIWQRWKNYASNGHGNNKELLALFKKNPASSQKFRFSILETMAGSAAEKEVKEVESLYKKKLGSRMHGLNSN